MLLIEHRVNTVAKLRQVPRDRGVEIDIRDYEGQLRCVHDPLLSGEPLEALLREFRHACAIFNVKCDGLESRIEHLAAKYALQNYFFLDVASPTLVQMARRGKSKIAVRFSEYEAIEFALKFGGQIEWVWVDCFSRFALDQNAYRQLKKHFKICLVSPELQQHPRSMIAEFRSRLRDMRVDAVCSDYCADWV